MTMIIAFATERFALVVGDRLTIASTDGETTMASGEVRPFKAGDKSDGHFKPRDNSWRSNIGPRRAKRTVAA